MFQTLTMLLNGGGMVIRVLACVLIGTVMVLFVGLPLMAGGRGEAAIPMLLGMMAFVTAAKEVVPVVRRLLEA